MAPDDKSRIISHPTHETIHILGTQACNNGRSCEWHDICGLLVEEDSLVRLKKVSIPSKGGALETAIAVYLVSEGLDTCRVGFLGRHCAPNASRYDGRLAQVTEVFSQNDPSPIKRKKFHHNKGFCVAKFIECTFEQETTPPSPQPEPKTKKPRSY
uniref:Uncharacterized protein n=1 Tax=Entomoneis paludosa TaxID=265537 RepID=A0A6U3BKK2_9STRA|mmetsp:Transcript_31790/g.66360  ORF Transcript_31790/g.66360 Transcript_31790/m.66360 type:complete len:156 (+) Transcript_31790:22-489(+)